MANGRRGGFQFALQQTLGRYIRSFGAGPARDCPAQLNECPNLPVINFGASVKHSRGFFR
jgi:hypothetical protein